MTRFFAGRVQCEDRLVCSIECTHSHSCFLDSSDHLASLGQRALSFWTLNRFAFAFATSRAFGGSDRTSMSTPASICEAKKRSALRTPLRSSFSRLESFVLANSRRRSSAILSMALPAISRSCASSEAVTEVGADLSRSYFRRDLISNICLYKAQSRSGAVATQSAIAGVDSRNTCSTLELTSPHSGTFRLLSGKLSKNPRSFVKLV